MILVRHINIVDAKKILVWRNHKQTRENSVNKNLTNQTDHVEWLKKSLIDKSKFLCLAFDSSTISYLFVLYKYFKRFFLCLPNPVNALQ